MRFVIYTFEFLPFRGGIATYCHELARGLAALGHEVTVVAPTRCDRAQKPGIYRVVRIAKSNGRVALMVNGVRALRRVVRRSAPDVVLATDQYALVSLAFFGGRLGATSVPIIHGSEVLRHSNRGRMSRKLVAWRMRRFYKGVPATICVSKFARDLFLREFEVQRRSVCVVHNGMKDGFCARKHNGAGVRRLWNVPTSSALLLTVARLVPRKGQDTIIRALPRIIEERPDVFYVCVGEGPYAKTLSELAADLGLQDHVVFPGKVAEAEKYSYYAACDLFVMPSRQHGETVEGFGLSFLEAWHASKAVLGGRHGGVVEVIEDGVDGAIVDPHSVESVADGVLRLLRDPSRLRQMGLRGKEKASSMFSETTMARLVVEGLDSVKLLAR